MNTQTVIIIIAVFVPLGVLSFLIWKKLSALGNFGKDDKAQEVLMKWLEDMSGRQDQMTKTQNDQLSQMNRQLNERLDNAAKVIGGVQKELGTMSELGKQMKDLQNFMLSPKLRGGVGEQVLRDLLEQVLPHEHFSIQYKFKDGQIVDALIKTDRGLIPIDSKFPMENFKRLMASENEEEKESHRRAFTKDVKKHVDDIAKKYILPAEGTVDFAVMYIPSESVYYEVIVNDTNLNTYAQEKKILFVSPNSFYYFLKVILMGLEGKRVEEGAKKILETLGAIRQEAGKFGRGLEVLSGHITKAKNSMDSVSSQFQTLGGRIESIRQLPGGPAEGTSEGLLGIGEDGGDVE